LSSLLEKEIRTDLGRPHPFAAERVSFVSGVQVKTPPQQVTVLLRSYHPVNDDNYIQDKSVGARIDGVAIRRAMQIALDHNCSIFHVHEHWGKGIPGLSNTDKREIPRIVDSLVNVAPTMPHGILLLSADRFRAFLRLPHTSRLLSTVKVTVVGFPYSLGCEEIT
jgi:hypothetical protein